MKYQSQTNNWRWINHHSVEQYPMAMRYLNGNPDVQYDLTLNGYWVKPDTKTWTLMCLTGIVQETTSTHWHTNITGPSWRDHD